MKFYKNLCEAVIRSLQSVFFEGRYADKVIEYTFKHNKKLGARDRRFIAENTYDMIRWWRLLCDVSKVREVTDAAGIWKLFGTWCILNEWELPEWPQLKGLDKEQILESYARLRKIRRVRESVPDWMDELVSRELGERVWERELHALNEEAKVVLRVNTLKTSLKELQKKFEELEILCEPLPEVKNALVMGQRKNVFRYPEFKEGFFEVQDASSQQVGLYLDVKPGMRVIDACAGAGGKTLQLAALMENKGKIIAMDPEQWKLDELKKRARRAGAGNIETRVLDSGKVVKRMENSADRLLLDVPCSGLGVLRRNPDAKWKLSPEFIQKVKNEQESILNEYPVMLKKGGVMVYSTCSILPSENHLRVQEFLSGHPDFELLREDTLLPSQGFDGFYMAAMRKKN
ncbi:MAG TPA: RsmB/NOP family class I SAM-dependent RNA methyltransferase [Bacteroidia bacterium]|jgi:16S rRNA (cytosine967-C5)-methyltransferase